MKRLAHPLWTLVSTTLPILLYFVLQFHTYKAIRTELPDGAVYYWLGFGLVLFLLVAIHTVLALRAALQGKELSLWVLGVFFVGYLVWLFSYFMKVDTLVPWGIPAWLLPGDRVFYVGSFIVPGLVHLILQRVVRVSPRPYNQYFWRGGLEMMQIPIAFYLLMVIIVPLIGAPEQEFFVFSFICSVVLAAFWLLYLVLRAFWFFASRKQMGRGKQYVLYAVVGLVLPLVGLYVHEHVLQNPTGNYSSPWFYGLAVANGLLLFLPTEGAKRWLVIGLALRSAFLVFIGYFMLVMGPYLLLTLPMIIFWGMGFLIPVPFLLGYFQVVQFIANLQGVNGALGGWKTGLLSGSFLLVIPVAMGLNFLAQRATLFATLEYLYAAPLDGPSDASINVRHLKRIMEEVEKQSPGGPNGFLDSDGLETPLISYGYRWLVLDHLTLSERKRDLIRKVFLEPKEEVRMPWGATIMPPYGAQLDSVGVTSTFDREQNVWRSWVHLKVRNPGGLAQNEYTTQFALPAGAYLSNYYLDMPEGRKYGLLAEKKTALWVYRQIVSRRRDPGLLYYQAGRKVNFRVFPVEEEGRTTGFELVHHEPLVFRIDGESVTLGRPIPGQEPLPAVKTVDNATTYLSAEGKAALPVVARKPYLHFILPGGAGQRDLLGEHLSQARDFLSAQPVALREGARFSVAGAMPSYGFSMEGSEFDLRNHEWVGYDFVGRVLEQMAFEQLTEVTDRYAIPVAIGINPAAQEYMEVPLWEYLPEAPPIYWWFGNRLYQQALNGRVGYQEVSFVDFSDTKEVLVHPWPNTDEPSQYVLADGQPGVVMVPGRGYPTTIPAEATTSIFEAGLLMEAQQYHRLLYSDQAQARWLDVVRTSFRHQLLSPATAFIVVENEAQEAALLRKQEQMLNSQHYLDPGVDELEPMPEPELWLLVVLFGGWLIWRRARR